MAGSLQQKYEHGMWLADLGRSNAEILEALAAQYGSGVATQKIAEWRQGTAARMKVRKRDLIRKVLLAGGSGYAAQQACQQELGTSVSYDLIREVQESLEAAPSGAVQEVTLPAELMADGPYDDPEALVEPEEVEGKPLSGFDLEVGPAPVEKALSHLTSLQTWMRSINAHSLSLTAEGRVKVMVEHTFCLGGEA